MSDQDRRTEDRYFRRMPVFVEVRDDPHNLECRPHIIKGYTTNFSRHGLQIVTARPLEEGDQQLTMYLLEQPDDALTLSGAVRWCRINDRHSCHGFSLAEARETDYLLWYNRAARASLDLTPEDITEESAAPASP